MALGLGACRAVVADSGRRCSTPWSAPEHDVALAGIGAADDVPIARRRMVGRASEHRFERGMAVEAAIVAEDDPVEPAVPGWNAVFARPMRDSATRVRML